MKTNKLLTIILICLLSSNILSAQNKTKTDTAQFDFSAINQQNIFLDSMLTRWYVKKSIANQVDKSDYTDNIITDVSDSVYRERLSKIMSPIEMTYNQDVKRWLDIYIKKNKRTPAVIGLMEYYSPIFEEILDAKGLPLEFKYLPIIESALNPRARSRAGATGLWQFMYSTGRMYGLEINSYVDARRDPIAASHAAANFLSDLYTMYNDWTLVLAAYNCGPGNVNKAIRRAKQKTNFWEIYQYLPRETRGYVPAFIAATYVLNYYKEHNIRPIKVDMNLLTDTVMINRKLHFAQISEVLHIPMEEIRELNPQYKKDIIPAHIKSYSLKLPIKYSLEFITLEDSIFAYKDSVLLGIKKNVAINTATKKYSGKKRSYSTSNYTRKAYTPPSTKGKTKMYYTVKQGDNFGFIASWYNVGVSDIKYWNNAHNNKLKIGQKITVYVPIKKASYYRQVNALTFTQKQARKGKISVETAKKTVKDEPVKSNDYVWHKIRKGESLWLIAKNYPGVSDKDIRTLNSLSYNETKHLKAGRYLKIKRKN